MPDSARSDLGEESDSDPVSDKGLTVGLVTTLLVNGLARVKGTKGAVAVGGGPTGCYREGNTFVRVGVLASTNVSPVCRSKSRATNLGVQTPKVISSTHGGLRKETGYRVKD